MSVGQNKKYPKLEVRASEAQLLRWRKLAEKQGMTLPRLVRALLDRAAERSEGSE